MNSQLSEQQKMERGAVLPKKTKADAVPRNPGRTGDGGARDEVGSFTD